MLVTEFLEQNSKKLNFNEIDKIIDKISKQILSNKDKSNCIGLIGDLGTGKTTFTKKLLKLLGVNESVKSPSFTYLIEYNTKDLDIYHFDVYRLNDSSELYSIGFYDYLDNNGLVIIEWADIIIDELPEYTLFIEIKHCDLEYRYLSIYKIVKGVKQYVDLSYYNI